MVSRPTIVVWGLVAAQTLALAATSRLTGLGTSPSHHVASLFAVLAAAIAAHRSFTRSRRFLAMGVLATSVLAAVSGFWLLYWKESIRIAGYQDWGVFWHVAWSWAAAVFFFQHTWINRVAYLHFVRESVARLPVAGLHLGSYVLLVAAFFVTWTIGKAWFTVENYIPFSLYAWLILVVPSYALWTFARVRSRRAQAEARDVRLRARGRVDVALVPVAALAVLSGIPLTFFDAAMEANGWKYVSKFWHVWPSVLFSVLVFAHSIHTWRTMRAHWRKYAGTPVAPTLEPAHQTPRKAA